MGIRGEIDGRERDVSQETRFSTLEGHMKGKETRVRRERVSQGTKRPPGAHLVEAEEAQVTDHAESTDSGPGGDLSCHLQADLHNLQWVGEDHLRASSLDSQQEELVLYFLKHSTMRLFIFFSNWTLM